MATRPDYPGDLSEIAEALRQLKLEGGGVTAKDSTRRLLLALAIFVVVLLAIMYPHLP